MIIKGIFKTAYDLGEEAASSVKKTYDVTTKAGQQRFLEEAYRNVETFSQLGRYSHIGGELMRMKDTDRAVRMYDDAVAAGIKKVLINRQMHQRKVKKVRKS